MLVEVFDHSNGPAARAVNYLLSGRNPDGTERTPKPEVMPGNDPETVRRLIDSLEGRFTHTYTSGAISFAPEDRPTPELEGEVMQEFEKIAFAGLRRDQYAILWVKHQHTGSNRTELHFLVPRVELRTGKSLNIAPPGWEGLFNTFRETYNALMGWASPDDPARAQDVSLPDRIKTLQKHAERRGEPLSLHGRNAEDRERLRMEITEYVRREVDAGRIRDRAGVIAYLKGEGFTLTREGKEYLSVIEPQTGIRVRLKGGLYHRDAFNPRDQADRTIRYGEPDPERAMVHAGRLEDLAEARAAYHRSRYCRPDADRTHGRTPDGPDRAAEELEQLIQAEARRAAQRQRRSRIRRLMEQGLWPESEPGREPSDPGTGIHERFGAFGAALQRARGRLSAAFAALDREIAQLARDGAGLDAADQRFGRRRSAFAAGLDAALDERWWQRFYRLEGTDLEPER